MLGKEIHGEVLREGIDYKTIQRMGAAGGCWCWVLSAAARRRSRAVEEEGLEELSMENLVPVSHPHCLSRMESLFFCSVPPHLPLTAVNPRLAGKENRSIFIGKQ